MPSLKGLGTIYVSRPRDHALGYVCVALRALCPSHERNARQLALQVGSISLAVLGVMQHRIDVVKDVPLGDAGVVVVCVELV